MTTQLSTGVWWYWLSIATAVLVGCYEINVQNSEQYMMSLFVKLSIISSSAAFYYIISQSLCKRSESWNTHKVKPSETNNERDSSLLYGTIAPNQPFTWTKHNHSQFLESHGTDIGHYGAYTVLRTVDKYHLFQFEMHVQRLCTTLQQYIHRIRIPSKVLRRLLIVRIRDGLDDLFDDDMATANEARIVIYIDICNLLTLCDGVRDMTRITNTKSEQLLSEVLWIHFGGLPDLKSPIAACIRMGRHTFTKSIKTTKWTDDRNRFRKSTDDRLSVNEVIMCDYDGFVMEGLSSNFAVLRSDLRLLTASTSDGVLNGTLRGFLIDIMDEMKVNQNREKVKTQYGVIPKDIVYGKPLLAEMMEWKGVAIMSTSRLLIPIRTLYIDIEDDTLLKLVGNDANHPIFKLEKSDDSFHCGYRKIVFVKSDDGCLENVRVFLKQNMKSHSVYVGSVFNQR